MKEIFQRLINSILKRVLWSVLLGGVFAEWFGLMDSNSGNLWLTVLPVYILLTYLNSWLV